MSIPDIFDKIKQNTGIDKVTVLYLFIIIGVGIASFGLGRLSLDNKFDPKGNNNWIISEKENVLENQNVDNSNVLTASSIQSGEKRYVASKNGKMYYSLGCSGAKRIKPENEIWFSTKEDAEKSGFTFSSTCK
jgi:hypothetical protein